jgi:hypothetical protein
MKGAGVAAALEHIRKSFLGLHGDQRDREQREASRRLEAELATDDQTVEVRKTERPEQVRARTARLANAFVQSALRSPHVHLVPSQHDSNGCYEVDVPS